MPDLYTIQVILQAVSSIALSIGLIYTAIQFRNFKRAQHVANFTRLVELQMHLREMRVNDPTLARVYRHDVQHAADETEVREYFFNLMQMSVFEIVWFAHEQGQVPPDYYRSWDNRMQEIAAEPSFRRMMATPSMKLMHDSFQNHMKQMVQNTAERD